MLRNGAASLHGSTNVQKVCWIHVGRGHLSRRQLTSCAFDARVLSSIYRYILDAQMGAKAPIWLDVSTAASGSEAEAQELGADAWERSHERKLQS